jgi:hypothetical protein
MFSVHNFLQADSKIKKIKSLIRQILDAKRLAIS